MELDLESEEGRQRKAASDHMVRGVDFLFALTIGQGILLFRGFWTDPLDHNNLTVALALAAVYFTTVQSFIDWHIAMERHPYVVAWTERFWPRTLERMRFTVDLIIVATYAVLVVNAVPLVKDPEANLDVFLAGFPAIFILYLIWSMLRRRRYPDAGSPTAMAFAFAAFAARTRSTGPTGRCSARARTRATFSSSW